MYNNLKEDDTCITIGSYEKLGKAKGILSEYLDEKLKGLKGNRNSIAKNILKELVSSESTRRVLNYDQLIDRINVADDDLDAVLTYLVNARLLLRNSYEGSIIYEMAHEYLIEEIKKWFDTYDLEFKRLDELLNREVVNWRIYHTPIPRDRLELLYSERYRFRFNDEMRECFLYSALEANHEIAEWVKIAGNVSEKVLLNSLNNENNISIDARITSIKLLGQLGIADAVKPLINILHGDSINDFPVRDAVASSLVMIGLPAVTPLIESLHCNNSGLRAISASILGQIGDPNAINPLINALRDDSETVREISAKSLKMIDDVPMELLLAALEESNVFTRITAADILAIRREPQTVGAFLKALNDDSKDVRRIAAKSLGEIGDSSVIEPLISSLHDNSKDVINAASEALTSLGNFAVGPLIEVGLHDQDIRIRSQVIVILGEIGDPSAINPLLAKLIEEDEKIRSVAITSLKMIKNPPLEPLFAALKNDDLFVRKTITDIIDSNRNLPIKPLIAALRDTNIHVRQLATKTLIRTGKPSLESLIPLLRDENSSLRKEVADILGEIKEPDAALPLISALYDENKDVSHAAALALVKIENLPIDPLITALLDKNSSACKLASEVLWKIRNPSTIDRLINILRNDDKDIRLLAVETLIKLNVLSVKQLKLASKDDDDKVRYCAVLALSRIEDPNQVDCLLFALQDMNSDIRNISVNALRRISNP